MLNLNALIDALLAAKAATDTAAKTATNSEQATFLAQLQTTIDTLSEDVSLADYVVNGPFHDGTFQPEDWQTEQWGELPSRYLSLRDDKRPTNELD